MDQIMALAQLKELQVVEDCAQAHGARCGSRMVGSIGDIGAWSFCQDKIMTTGGEGGMVTTKDQDLWAAMWSYKDHGKSWQAVYEREHPPGFRWLHESFGTNWRMLEIQGAIGRIQLRRVGDWMATRTSNARRIAEACQQYAGLRVPLPDAHLTHAFYRLYAYVQPKALNAGWTRDRIVAEITARGVPCYQGSCSEVYLEKAFDGTGLRPAHRLPVARELGDTSVMFLVHPTLTAAEIDQTCTAIGEVLSDASQPSQFSVTI
jgi:dTDP-4-amino-4,6-dideoxygalactose transaminase